MSAEPRVLLEFEVGDVRHRIVDKGFGPIVEAWVSECPFDFAEHFCPPMPSEAVEFGLAVYDAMRAQEGRE